MKYLSHLPILLLFCVLAITGINTYRTYGTQWDEYLQRNMGRVNYNYIAEGNDSLLILNGRDYGIVVEFPLYVLEKKLAPNQPAASTFIRHLACYLLFCGGVFFFYLTILKLRFSNWWAFFGACMLVLSPRIYGHAFINSKDVPLMVFYIIAYYALLCFIERPDIKRSFYLALSTALLIDTRITGVIMVPITILFFYLFEFQKSEQSFKSLLTISFLKKLKYYFIFCALLVYLFWPYLWLNPIKNFLVAFLNMSHYRWKGYSLLFGDFIYSFDTPWYFALSWIAITTPLLYLCLYFVGFTNIVYQLVQLKKQVFKHKVLLEKLMALSLFMLPLLAIIVLKSVLYDTWRHVYFVYPFLLIVGMYGAQWIYEKLNSKLMKWSSIALFNVLIVAELVKMANAFPNEYVYFNELVSDSKENIRYQYDMDYWGTTFKLGFEKILETDKRDTIKVTGNCYPAYSNYNLLKHMNPKCRLQYVLKEKEANYYLTNYRFKPDDHDKQKDKKFYGLRYRNSEILGVYKLR
jgi:hypothetical protein